MASLKSLGARFLAWACTAAPLARSRASWTQKVGRGDRFCFAAFLLRGEGRGTPAALRSRNARNSHAPTFAGDVLTGLYCRSNVDRGVGILDKVLFTGGTVSRGDSLYFTCIVEYPAELDAFLPSELTNRIDRAGSAIAPFSDGKGQFVADSLKHAEETEADIGALLQTALRDLQEMQRRTELWTGVREFALDKEGIDILPSLSD